MADEIVYQLYLDGILFTRYRDYYKHERTAKGAVTSYSDALAQELAYKNGHKRMSDMFIQARDEYKKKFTIKAVPLSEAIVKIGATRKSEMLKLVDKIMASNNPLIMKRIAQDLRELIKGDKE
jgi:hypothetical protein